MTNKLLQIYDIERLVASQGIQLLVHSALTGRYDHRSIETAGKLIAYDEENDEQNVLP